VTEPSLRVGDAGRVGQIGFLLNPRWKSRKLHVRLLVSCKAKQSYPWKVSPASFILEALHEMMRWDEVKNFGPSVG
jgi:hypothetical protein